MGHQKTQTVRQMTWLCGTEYVLIEDVLTTIKATLGVSSWNLVAMNAEQDSARDIWSALDEHGVDDGFRLVIIREAQEIKNWDRWLEWVPTARTLHPKTYVVMISSEDRVATLPVTRKGERPEVAEHVAAFARRGHVVECRPFTQATAKHALSWALTKAEMPPNVATHLLNRANGNLRLVRDLCMKLSLYAEAPTVHVVNALLSERPRETFEEALLIVRKHEALVALEHLDPEEYSRVLGLLDANLDFIGMLHDLSNNHASAADIARAAGARAFLVPQMMPLAKRYPPQRRLALRKVMVTIDEAIKGGAREGTLEALVAIW